MTGRTRSTYLRALTRRRGAAPPRAAHRRKRRHEALALRRLQLERRLERFELRFVVVYHTAELIALFAK